MQREHVTQRELAKQIGVTQGHLSKVLRGKTERDTRVLADLTAWSGGEASTEEAKLVDAARALVGDRPRGMKILMHLMHVLRELQGPTDRPPRGRSRARR